MNDQLQPNIIPSIHGLKIGDKNEEVERLNKYLMRYGYIKSADANLFNNIAGVVIPKSYDVTSFDDNTKVALELFQEFNGLCVTGELDEQTLTLIQTPRCGCSDLVANFATAGSKWPDLLITFSLNFAGYTRDITTAAVRGAINDAFYLWSIKTPLQFKEVALGSGEKIAISFESGAHGDDFPFDGISTSPIKPINKLAHAFYPPPYGGSRSGQIHFDDDESWTITVPVSPGSVDLIQVAAHEIGHALGFIPAITMP